MNQLAYACPVRERPRERTGDGRQVGRCYCSCIEGVCPRHGDVSEALRVYFNTGRLTDERDIRPGKVSK